MVGSEYYACRGDDQGQSRVMIGWSGHFRHLNNNITDAIIKGHETKQYMLLNYDIIEKLKLCRIRSSCSINSATVCAFTVPVPSLGKGGRLSSLL